MIAQRFDFLMRLTGTKNSALAKALAFDASYISRIRSGERGIPNKQPFIGPAADYFARRIREPYQIRAVTEQISPNRPFSSGEELAELLEQWLGEDAKDDWTDVLRPLEGENVRKDPVQWEAGQRSLLFSGNAGKREGVLLFLRRIAETGEPHRLFLFSDEDMTWMYEDASFAQEWTGLMGLVISQGSRILIIHTISRNIREMLEALQKWMPLYATGAIDAYYYPHIRDEVYHRTIFLAQNDSALISNSVENHTEDSLNVYLTDSMAVRTLEREFRDYLALCRPLMQIYHRKNARSFREQVMNTGSTRGDWIFAQSVPMHYSLTPELIKKLCRRESHRPLQKYLLQEHQNFEEHLKHNDPVVEIWHLPDPKEARQAGVVFPFAVPFGKSGIRYHASELAEHIGEVMRLLAQYPNYHVVLSNAFPQELHLSAKEDVGTLFFSVMPIRATLLITERRLTETVREHLHRLAREGDAQDTGRALAAYQKALTLCEESPEA